MRGRLTVRIAIFTLGLLLAGAASVLGEDELALASDGAGQPPLCRIVARDGSKLTLELSIQQLESKEIQAGGETWQQLALPGGAFRGQEGQAALPIYSRLVAVAPGMQARIRHVQRRERILSGYRIMPGQPDGDEVFTLDRDYYARHGLDDTPAATVAAPAQIRSQWVVPVTFNPVRYDPATGDMAVCDQVTVELELIPQAGTAPANSGTGLMPESFEHLLRATVLGYEGAKGSVGPGTYLMICPDNASVTTQLQQLLDWRSRQGYNVLLATLTQTGTSNSQIKNYIQGIYNTVNPPLEYVVLAGDANGTYAVPTWNESVSGYSGEGDHYYATLEGGDVLADVHIGRLSFSNLTELQTITGKIMAYETDPWLDNDPGWFRRASLTGDPSSSGPSCIYVNQWVKAQLLDLGYAEIDTIWSGNFPSLMLNSLNRGHSFFGYRGYWGTSNFTTGYINASTNGEKLPFCVVLTCDTGSFQDDGECRSEAFLRHAGGGGIGAVGLATLGTHTRYNNCLYQGIVEGAFNLGDYHLGTALTRGKLEMYNNYQGTEPVRVETWSVWGNLMGDPATEMWTGMPKDLFVDFPSSIPTGTTSLPVTVTGSGAIPLAGARVSLYKRDEILLTGYTNAAGQVILPLPALTDGSLSVTVTRHDFLPFLGSLTIGTTTAYLVQTSATVDDDGAGSSSGNGDGLVNPGETLELALELTNLGTTAATGVTVILTTEDPFVTILDGADAYPDLAPGAAAWGSGGFLLAVDPGTPSGHVIPLQIDATAGAGSWTSLLELTVHEGAVEVVSLLFGGPGGNLDPGESGSFTVRLRNTGNLAIGGAAATLLCSSPWISITDAQGSYGSIDVGQTAENTGDPFAISITSDCYAGHQVTFQVVLEFASDALDTALCHATVGTKNSDDPVGPDAYSYYGFDDTDTGYSLAPVFQWVETDPDYGGSGTSLGLSDYGDGQDDSVPVDLPFTFTFYGKPYNKITVCSNGWLAMGHSYLVNYRNWSLPCAGAPNDMVAVFWDDLKLDGGADVLVWNDAVNHRFVIQWSRLRSTYNNSIETFEAILYDPAHHASDTGDGPVLLQYQTVNLVDSQTGYATVGIQNHDHTDGVLYTYYNRYASGAASLTTGRAIRFQPVLPQVQGYLEGDVTNISGSGTPVAGATIRILESGRSLITQTNGHYFGSSPAGQYTVVCEHPSFRPDTSYAVLILEEQTTLLDFALVDVAGPDLNLAAFPGTDDTVGPYGVDCWVTDESPLAEMHFYYTSSSAGGPFELTLMLVDPGTGQYRAQIPGQPSGTLVQYWATARDVAANASVAPAGAPWSPLSFQVGGTSVVFADDMEMDRGWTVGDTDDDATTGIWTRVDPNGVWNSSILVQPEDDATPSPGTLCWITGNDPPGSSQGTDDVDNGKTTLFSPWIDLHDVAGNVTFQLTYRRWYTNDTGNSPGEDVWLVQVTDNGTSWSNLESTQASLRSWSFQEFSLEDYVNVTGSVRVRFVASDEGSGSIVEAGVDEFLLLARNVIEDAAPPTVILQNPNGGEALGGGEVYKIGWNASDDIGVVMAHVLLSQDGGASYPDTLISGPLRNGWSWTVPQIEAASCRLRVVVLDAAQNAASDDSDGNFSISSLSAAETPVARLDLGQNAPNPFNPRTEITFHLPRAQQAALRIYDLEGKLVQTLIAGRLDAGLYTAVWDGTDGHGARVSSGLYFYRLETHDRRLTRKMLLLK
jgi:hypothetical protein